MRITTFFIFLLLTSGVLFTPMLQPAQEVELIPQQTNEIIIVMRSTQLEVSSSIASQIVINVSLVEDNGDLRTIETNKIILSSGFISVPSQGTYEVSVYSDVFATISFKQSGFTTFQLIYFTALILAFLFVITRYTGIIG